jgi:hypothetical protein
MERRHSLVVAHTCFFNIIIIILGFFFFFLAEVSPPPLANAFLFNKHASCKSGNLHFKYERLFEEKVSTK